MKRKKLSVLAVCLALLLGLLAGCGGGKAEVTAEDFHGCWKYSEFDPWVIVHEDGTYEWVDGDNVGSGSYTIEGDELVLDNGLRFAPDGSGGLIDSEGDTLFPSELPDHISGPVALSAA